MRSLEITIFLMLIAPALALVNNFGIFDSSTTTTADLTKYENKTVEDLSKFELKDDANIIDYSMFVITMAFQFIFWALQILLSIVWLVPMLTRLLNIPDVLGFLLNVGIWIIWVIGIIQIKHAVSFDGLR